MVAGEAAVARSMQDPGTPGPQAVATWMYPPGIMALEKGPFICAFSSYKPPFIGDFALLCLNTRGYTIYIHLDQSMNGSCSMRNGTPICRRIYHP